MTSYEHSACLQNQPYNPNYPLVEGVKIEKDMQDSLYGSMEEKISLLKESDVGSEYSQESYFTQSEELEATKLISIVNHQTQESFSNVPTFMTYLRGLKRDTRSSGTQNELFFCEYSTWVDIQGISTEELQEIGNLLDLHPLTIEDCCSEEESLDKYELFPNYLFIVVKDFSCTLNVLLFHNYVVTIHNKQIPALDVVFSRIKTDYEKRLKSSGKKKKKFLFNSPDFVFYAFLDQVADNYNQLSLKFERQVDIEESIFMNLSMADMNDGTVRITNFRKRLRELKRLMITKEQIIRYLFGSVSLPFLQKSIQIQMRDVVDHLNKAISMTEEVIHELQDLQTRHSLRINVEIALLNTHLVEQNQRTAHFYDKLAVLGFVLGPTTMLSSLFGVNFPFPGVIGWKKLPWHSYCWFFSLLIFMITVTVSLLILFRKKLFAPPTNFGEKEIGNLRQFKGTFK